MRTIDRLRLTMEKYGLDVSYRLANRLGIPARNVRMFFIYLSFPTLGLSFFLYILLAFALRVKDTFYRKRPDIFDL